MSFLPTVSVVVLFFVSWAPFHFQRLGYVYFREHEYFRTVNQYLFYLSGCFYFLSSTLNPVLYNLMSAKYREAFKRALLCQPDGSPRRGSLGWLPHTLATSTTNLLTSSFVGLHLKEFLESRRASRVSGRSEQELFGRQRSASLDPVACLVVATPGRRTNLCRYTLPHISVLAVLVVLTCSWEYVPLLAEASLYMQA